MNVGTLEADVFRAIADPTRRALLDLLLDGERPVKALQVEFGMTQPAISQHLRVLRVAGLVEHRRVGREHRYRMRPAPLLEVAAWMAQYEDFWRGKLDALRAHLRRTP
jgi:DNA-binding transcriptional ArsR family regulator